MFFRVTRSLVAITILWLSLLGSAAWAELRFSLIEGANGQAQHIKAEGFTDSQWQSIVGLRGNAEQLNNVLRLYVIKDAPKAGNDVSKNAKDVSENAEDASKGDRSRPNEAGAARPSIFGDVEIDEKLKALRFVPRYALADGLAYRVEVKLPASSATVQQWDFHIAERKRVPKAKVVEIYPTANKLPENLLKFYIHFSAPMTGGDAYRHLELIASDGRHIEHPFLELAEELWDPSYQRLTLLLDPARVKHGLVPREEDGAILEAGKKYRLSVSQRWEDVQGAPMLEGFAKEFEVVAGDNTQPDPHQWKITPPRLGERSVLSIDLVESLDHAIVARGIQVLDAKEQIVPGEVSLAERERVWRFVPDAPWQAGEYQLKIDDRIEDLAGNSIERPFELDRFDKVEAPQPKHIRLKFSVHAAR